MTADNKGEIVEIPWNFLRGEDERLRDWLDRLPITEKEIRLLREQAEKNQDLTGK